MTTRITLALLCVTTITAAAAAYLQAPPTCHAAACRSTTCISSAGCISPCVCAKNQGDAYGVCVSVE